MLFLNVRIVEKERIEKEYIKSTAKKNDMQNVNENSSSLLCDAGIRLIFKHNLTPYQCKISSSKNHKVFPSYVTFVVKLTNLKNA